MSQLTDRLAGLDREALRAFFHGHDAEAITELIRETSDDELVRLVADDDFREEGIVAILERFPEFADPDRMGSLKGTVCFDLTRPDGPGECHTVHFDQGRISLGAERPDVTITATVTAFVRLVTGQANAALLYLSDRLSIAGDATLALDVGSVFRLPGSHLVAVDPTALDPVDVATAIKDVSRAHLAEVMGGDFRDLVIGEVFRRFPEFLDARKAARQRLHIGFRIAGRPDGGADRYLVHVVDGGCTVEADPGEGARRDATLLLDGPDFLRLVTGHVNPVKALMAGRLKLKGDRTKALAFNAVMNPPKPR
ncbi:MAG TPA: SCP2 sterol-binding domain-containing protein [Marmoricola sp.]|nr:SCP2 sterol-binding domain-containing protein [Marmoricola sp.]